MTLTPARILILAVPFAFPVLLLAQERVTVVGSVLDSLTREPIHQATVYLMSGERAVTDGNGRFRLTGVARSSTVLALRRIGYVPRGIPLRAQPGTAEVNLGTLTMTPAAIALDSISVRARLIARNHRLTAFYDRMRTGQGRYFTRNAIWKMNPLYITEVIQTVAGVRCGIGGCSARVASLSGSCGMQIFVDGIRTDMEVNEIPPSWIAGIEVYKGPATTPLEFGLLGGRGGQPGGRRQTGTACGTIVVWTGIDDQ